MQNRNLPSIFTDRLTLRAFRESDAQDVFDACSNPVLGRNAGWPPHKTLDDSLFYINEIAAKGFVWAVTKNEKDRVIGSVGLLADPRTPNDRTSMMLGYWMSDNQWNRGYMTEAARAVIKWGFAEGDLTRITTCHFLFNNASRRVIEKCGFEKREIAPFPSTDPIEQNQEAQWYELKRKRSRTASRKIQALIKKRTENVTSCTFYQQASR